MKFSFMTFSCPDLTWGEVLGVARRFGYEGVEPRAQAGHAHGIELEASPARRAELRRMADDAGIAVACLATSCSYTAAGPSELSRRMDETRALIALARDIGAPSMRVFGGRIPDGMSREHAEKQLADCLAALAPEAAEAGVALCVETHDSWCDARILARVLAAVGHPSVRANWDIMHPVRVGMSIEEAFEALGPFVGHCHFHDGRESGGRFRLCPVGEGVVDHRRAVELLLAADYGGFMSGEWIGWEDPWEVHLPREVATMRAYLG